MNQHAFQHNRLRPAFTWSPRNFRFDELDADSACLPYGQADVELPACFWGKTIMVEGKLIAADLPYNPRWQPSLAVKAFDRRWQSVLRATGLARFGKACARWLAHWPRIAAAPTLEVFVDGVSVLRHRPAQSVFVVKAELPPRPEGKDTFRVSFRLRNVTVANTLAGIAKRLRVVPMPLALWNRMRDWQFRNLQHRRLRIVSLVVDGALVIDFRGNVPAPGPAVRQEARLGLNIVGHFLAEHSIGDAVRGSARAADAAGIATCLVNLGFPLPVRQLDETLKARLSDKLTLPLSLYHTQVREAPEIEEYQGAGFMDGRYNIAYWAWESGEFREDWVEFARLFDEIWCPSHFAAEAIQMRVPIPVLTMPHVIEFAPPASGNLRAKFGLPERLFIFLFVFDMNSLAARKNPEAVVQAFRRVVAKNPATGLVLKTHNGDKNVKEMEQLRQEMAGVPNIFLMDRTLPREEVYELMACCDAFVSLHHAEGFGLCVAEAMYLGKPVVSTNWSATAEFVTPQNGFPVRYRLERLPHHSGVFVRGTEWAYPDVDHAASCMETLSADPQLCAALGAQGARDMRERFSAAAIGRRYAERLDSIMFW
jgi:glycosyltransferase involved in cell wall biosynthesis